MNCFQWDIGTCKGDVETQKAYRKIFDPTTWTNKLEETDEAEFKVEATGAEQVEQIRAKKKIMLSKQDRARLAAAKEEQELIETANREVIHVEDGSLIQNFEVDFPEEEELVMAGGVKGLRALRVQRAQINAQIATEEKDDKAEDVEAGKDRFAMYQQPSKQQPSPTQPVSIVKEADEQVTAFEEPKSAATPEMVVKLPERKGEGVSVSTEELEDDQENAEEIKEVSVPNGETKLNPETKEPITMVQPEKPQKAAVEKLNQSEVNALLSSYKRSVAEAAEQESALLQQEEAARADKECPFGDCGRKFPSDEQLGAHVDRRHQAETEQEIRVAREETKE